MGLAFVGGVIVGWLLPRPEPASPLVAEAPTSAEVATPTPAPPPVTEATPPPADAPRWTRSLPPQLAEDDAPAEPVEEPAEWPMREWADEGAASELTEDALELADETAEAMAMCPDIEVRKVDCSAPPCMVFFSAPGASCLALHGLDHHAPDCPTPLGEPPASPIVLAAPIVCPDGYRECVRAVVATNLGKLDQLPGFENAEGSETDREMEILFSVGHRLTQSAPDWACAKD